MDRRLGELECQKDLDRKFEGQGQPLEQEEAGQMTEKQRGRQIELELPGFARRIE